jgi:SH3 domain protein
MKKYSFIVLHICLISCLFLTSFVYAETRYVTDQFEITLRTGPSSSHAIQRMVKSGAALKILETDEEKGYSRVQAAGDVEGWVLNRYLMREPAARTQLERLTKQLTNTNAKGSSLRTQFNTIKNEHDNANKRIASLEREKKQLQDQLAEIKRTAADVLTIDMQNKELHQQLAVTQKRFNELQQENNELGSNKDRDWFVAGALVLFGGLILGLIIPKISFQKRSRYGGF